MSEEISANFRLSGLVLVFGLRRFDADTDSDPDTDDV
jgi:hypothetical protein